MGTIALQWSLNQTSNDLVGVSRGILEAATSDNVQALALLACESFGACLAMSQESCQKAFQLCSRSHESAMVSFLKAQIGYRKGDSAWQLSQSDAGLRFLGLAACLATMGPWNAAVALQKLVHETASDKRLIPTTQHLKQLMQALETKLARSGFADNALGWAMILKEMEDTEDNQNQSLLPGELMGTMAPTPKAVSELITAMSRLARVGEEVQRIEIEAPLGHAPWFVTFIKWCLGAPPTIIFYNGRTFGPDGNQQVIMKVSKNCGKAQEIRISLCDYTGTIKNLVRTVGSLSDFGGMVGPAIYGQATLRRLFGTKNDLAHRACIQALPYACEEVRKKMAVYREWSTAEPLSLDRSLDPDITIEKGQVFPPTEKICQALHDYLGGRPDDPLPKLVGLSDGGLVQDLPLVSLLKSQLAKECHCSLCANIGMNVKTSCKFQKFLGDLSDCVAQVLALSIINPAHQEGVKIKFSTSATHGRSSRFSQHIKFILTSTGRNSGCSVSDIYEQILNLLGHDDVDRHRWVMSSHHDQAIYPAMLASQHIQPSNVLALECIPGVLMWGSQQYSKVEVALQLQLDDEDSDTELDLGYQPYRPAKIPRSTVLQPQDNFAAHKLEWKLRAKESHIEVILLAPKFPTFPERNPRFVLDSLTESVFINCAHDQLASFTTLNSSIYLTHPADPTPKSQDTSSIGLVQCDKNEQIRFFTLASGQPAIIRQDACIECCLKYCQLLTRRFVVT